jgi:hypothetical protein
MRLGLMFVSRHVVLPAQFAAASSFSAGASSDVVVRWLACGWLL